MAMGIADGDDLQLETSHQRCQESCCPKSKEWPLDDGSFDGSLLKPAVLFMVISFFFNFVGCSFGSGSLTSNQRTAGPQRPHSLADHRRSGWAQVSGGELFRRHTRQGSSRDGDRAIDH